VDKLFEAFVQTDSGKKSQMGTGLGLVISQQFAQFMGSHISIRSTLNKGTIFEFDLTVEEPIDQQSSKLKQVDYKDHDLLLSQIDSEEPIQAIAANEQKGIDKDISPLRILLVEDNTFNQMIALRLLAKLGYHADCAVNGLEVLATLEHQEYDVILMDLQMPVMDGLEATRRIRLLEKQTQAKNKVKIIAMTANAMAEDREKCMLLGMDDFISKPVRIEYLAEILKNISSESNQKKIDP